MNVLKKSKKNVELEGNGDDADIFVMTNKVLKKQKGEVSCTGGDGADTFVLQKSKKSELVIEDYESSEDFINTTLIKGKIKIKNVKKDAVIMSGGDILATVEGAAGDLKVKKGEII